MSDPRATALLIAGLGMGLLFLALVLFWGLLSLLTWQRRPQPLARPTENTEEGALAREELVLRAAAVAVVLARAEADGGWGTAGPPAAPAGAAPSAWWSLHHQRQLAPWTAAPPGRQAWEGRQTLDRQRCR